MESTDSVEHKVSRKSVLKKDLDQREREVFCSICKDKMGANGVKVATSHSIKRETLRLISSVDGVVLNSLDKTEGVGVAGTFRMICRTCEGNSFTRYENRISDSGIKLDKEDLAEMALKVSLLNLSISNQVEALKGKEVEDIPAATPGDAEDQLDYFYYLGEVLRAKEYENMDDVKQYQESFEIALQSSKNKKNAYYMIMDEFLDYLAPVASCALVTIGRGIDGKIFQDITLQKGFIKEVFVFITPTKEGKTRVTVFCEMKFQGTFKHLKKISKKMLIRYFFLEMIVGKDFGFYFNPVMGEKMPSDMRAMMKIGDFRELHSQKNSPLNSKKQKMISENGYLECLRKSPLFVDKEFRIT